MMLKKKRRDRSNRITSGPPLWIGASTTMAIIVLASIIRSADGTPIDAPIGLFVMLGIFAGAAHRIYRKNGNRVWYWQQILFICIALVIAILAVMLISVFNLNTLLVRM